MSSSTKTTHNTAVNIFAISAQALPAKARQAVLTIYEYVREASAIMQDKDADYALSQLGDMQRQTYEAIEHSRHLNPIIKNFATTVRTYHVDIEYIEALFSSLRMDISSDSFTQQDYRAYVEGRGEALALMVMRVLCYRRAVKFHKCTPGTRALGAAIAKIELLQAHGDMHRQRGRLPFPDITKATFNRARLAQIIVEIEADFRKARQAIADAPPGSKRALTILYSLYYELLIQMRSLSPLQIDKGQAQITNWQKYWIVMLATIRPKLALQRGSRY